MSKFKITKPRIGTKDALVAVTSIASIIANVADMTQFLPARAAASCVLVILKTVQEIDNNKIACYRLARRSAKILVDLNTRMAGRWDSAPKALVENIQDFERTLTCARDFMFELKRMTWTDRLFRKGSIEDALADFHELLSEAEQSFQIASLVEIHYTVGVLQERSTGKVVEFVENTVEGPCPEYSQLNSIAGESFRSKHSKGDSDGISDIHPEEDLPTKPISVVRSSTSPEGLDEDLSSKANAAVLPATSLEVTNYVAIKDEAEELQLQEELKELDRFGFKRYHQADLCLLSEVGTRNPDSFWTNSMLADAAGKRVVVKRYDGIAKSEKENLNVASRYKDAKEPSPSQPSTACRLFGREIPGAIHSPKSMQEFLSQILLGQELKDVALVKIRDPSAFLLNALQNMTIAECAMTTLKIRVPHFPLNDDDLLISHDGQSAALYVQRQLILDERETQQFIAETNYSVDAHSGRVIVGIPTPKRDTVWGFAYSLTESLLEATMKILPSNETLVKDQPRNTVELQDKLAHIKVLARALLRNLEEKPGINKVSQALLEDAEFSGEDSLRLSRIRNECIRAGLHEYTWDAGIHSCPQSFSAGDFGYISRECGQMPVMYKSRFDHFVKVGNIFDDDNERKGSGEAHGKAQCVIIREVTGTYGQWVNGFHRNDEAWPFPLPDDVEGWAVALLPRAEMEVHVRHSARMASVSEAWRHLQHEAEARAQSLGINPEELILITKSVLGQIYKLRDWSSPPSPPTPFRHPTPFGQPKAFAHPTQMISHGFSHRPPVPRIVYLFTSFRDEFVPFLSDNPSASALPRGRVNQPKVLLSTAWVKPEMFIGYIQLSKEDFACP